MTCLMFQIIYTVRENKKLSNRFAQAKSAGAEIKLMNFTPYTC